MMAGYDTVPGEYVTYLKRPAEQYIAVPGESVDWPTEWGPRPLAEIPDIAIQTINFSPSSAVVYQGWTARPDCAT